MKKIKVGFYKKPQGVFTLEVIEKIKSRLREIPEVELFDNLDFTKFYIKNNQVFFEDFNVSSLDIYFWHDTLKPSLWQGDNFHIHTLELLGETCKVINTGESTRITNDKFLAHSVLKKHGLPVVDFALAELHDRESLRRIFEEFGGQVLIKPRFGGWGQGIVKITSVGKLLDIVELIASFQPDKKQQIFLEKYYPNDISKWTSVVVMGEKVLLGYRKKISDQDGWKIYDPEKTDGKGIYSDYIKPSPELSEVSLKAQKAIGKDIIGFDFIFTEEGYKIVDENSRPGLYAECLEKAGINIEEEVISLIRSKFSKKK